MSETRPLDVHKGSWWKFDRYEVRNRYIRPAPGAHGEEYNPWERYRESQARKRGQQPPYQSLLRLVQPLVAPNAFRSRITEAHPTLSVTPDLEKEVADWCAQYGLLGLLLERARMVALAPRWQTSVEWGRQLMPQQTVYRWARGKWEERVECMLPGPDPIPMKPIESAPPKELAQQSEILEELTQQLATMMKLAKESGTPMPRSKGQRRKISPDVLGIDFWIDYVKKCARAEAAKKGGLVKNPSLLSLMKLRQPQGVLLERGIEALNSRAWATYFPDVPKAQQATYEYPVPMSPQFWEMYAEPLEEFLLVALTLYYAVQLWQRRGDRQWGAHREKLTAATLALLSFDAVTLCSNPSEDGMPTLKWVSPSLVTSLQLMIYQDNNQERRVQWCKWKPCGGVFVNVSGRADYCTDDCRNAAQQSKYRERQRSKKQKRRGSSL